MSITATPDSDSYNWATAVPYLKALGKNKVIAYYTFADGTVAEFRSAYYGYVLVGQGCDELEARGSLAWSTESSDNIPVFK